MTRRAGRWWRQAVAGLLLVLIAFVAGARVEQTFPGAVPVVGPAAPSGEFDQAKVQQASRFIEANYYDASVGGRQLSQGSVEGMVSSLDDPFSRYLTQQQYQSQQDAANGRHDGVIGVSVVFQDGHPVVAGVLPNSPALRAGVRTDDVILQVDGTATDQLAPEQTSAMISGPDGSQVRLLLGRGAGTLDLTVTRERFQSPTVQSFRLPDDVLYLRVYQFGTNTEREFDAQLTAGLGGARGAVLDLRDNGGGLVSAAVAMVSRFVTAGEVFEERGRNGQSGRVFVDGRHPAASLPLVVLVNQGSASASEIVAGSLQSHGRAKLVGATTFGKGSVQVGYVLRDGSAIDLTVQHWYLPGGRSINGSGLTPDVPVDLPRPGDMFDVVQPDRGDAADTQLQRARQTVGLPG